MALDKTAVIPAAKIDSSDAAYTLGKAQNVTVFGDGTGTPYRADLVNDDFGYKEALLLEAEVTPSNVADTGLSSQYLQSAKLIHGAIAVDYAALRDKDSSQLILGTIITVTDDEIHGRFKVKSGNVSQLVGIREPFDDAPTTRYAERVIGTEDLINVKWTGATGDGSTNDHTAITDAIAAAQDTTLPGMGIYFPLGIYLVSSPIVYTQIEASGTYGFTIKGAGGESLDRCMIRKTSTSTVTIGSVTTNALFVLDSSTNDREVRGLNVTDLSFEGDGSGSPGLVDCFRFIRRTSLAVAGNNNNFERLSGRDFRYGFFGDTTGDSIYITKFIRCNFFQCEEAWRMIGRFTSTTWDTCYAHECTTGYRLKGARYSSMINPAADSNVTAYNFDDCNLTIIGLGSEANTTRVIRADNECHINIIGGSIANNQISSGDGVVESETYSRIILDGVFLREDDGSFPLGRTLRADDHATIIVKNHHKGGSGGNPFTTGDSWIESTDTTGKIFQEPPFAEWRSWSGTTSGTGLIIITHPFKDIAPDLVQAWCLDNQHAELISTTTTQFTIEIRDHDDNLVNNSSVSGTYYAKVDQF